MKKGFYSKLAWQGIKKNRKIYLPYIITCICMVMMYYILSFLSKNESVGTISGGHDLQLILSFGTGIISVFTVIFLFYTNSFIIRRRRKEFGLYNILGMDKWNIARILVCETVMIYAASIITGLICGVLFSKLAELFSAKLLNGNVNFDFTIEFPSVINTVLLFAGTFVLILLNSLRQIHISKPIELLHSDKVGEKPPKARWIIAAIGLIILCIAYYMSATIENPMGAIQLFFVAVIMVIVATYILFIIGSVAFCKLLQKSKNYYYKTNHFISVSSMTYRMKRNGASLASICILSTMVLVMISSTLCLYVGKEDNIRSRYPKDFGFMIHTADTAVQDKVISDIDALVKENDYAPQDILHYKYLPILSLYSDDILYINDESKLNSSNFNYIRQLFIFPVEEYNKLMNKNETLEKDEAILFTPKVSYDSDTITIEDAGSFKVKSVVEKFMNNGIDTENIVSSIYIFVADSEVLNMINNAHKVSEDDAESNIRFYYGFDLDANAGESKALYEKLSTQKNEVPVFCSCIEEERDSFYAMYSGLFLLGILLSIVFIAAAVLIMYYKQISEGYEDCTRFEIMQKVGMTKKEIRRSINSQVLTVFAAPLLFAGLHITFAYPIIAKLLRLFGLFNTNLFICVTVASFLVFAIFYVIVYSITSRSYYNIVSEARD